MIQQEPGKESSGEVVNEELIDTIVGKCRKMPQRARGNKLSNCDKSKGISDHRCISEDVEAERKNRNYTIYGKGTDDRSDQGRRLLIQLQL